MSTSILEEKKNPTLDRRLAGFGNPPFDPPRKISSSGFDKPKKQKRCIHCNRLIDIDSTYCKFCGKKIDSIESLVDKYLGDSVKNDLSDLR